MTGTPGPFRPQEFGGEGSDVNGREIADAVRAAKALEEAMPADVGRPITPFTDRVMAAVAAEPAPRVAGFLGGLRAAPGLASFVGSVRAAWSTIGTAEGRPLGVRAAALAYVLAVMLAVVSVTGAGALGTAGALGLLSGDRSPTPSLVSPSPLQSPEPSVVPEPSESPLSSDSAEPSESAGPSGSGEPATESTKPAAGSPTGSAAPAGTDDHGSSPQPSSSPRPSASDDSGGSASSSQTPRPSDTPEASATAH